MLWRLPSTRKRLSWKRKAKTPGGGLELAPSSIGKRNLSRSEDGYPSDRPVELSRTLLRGLKKGPPASLKEVHPMPLPHRRFDPGQQPGSSGPAGERPWLCLFRAVCADVLYRKKLLTAPMCRNFFLSEFRRR